jgi:hypothetical protein
MPLYYGKHSQLCIVALVTMLLLSLLLYHNEQNTVKFATIASGGLQTGASHKVHYSIYTTAAIYQQA